ncbi:hypothetical protein F5I97DRAFT_1927929 [Phlebopus sp. FC_14]|nr:hypothetical protein F5I97DRAFT_1927929 [Phlebopus sp. FC_14]
MTREIRFNSFGIPYIVEFANVSFHRRSSSSSSSFCRVPSSASSASLPLQTRRLFSLRSVSSFFSKKSRRSLQNNISPPTAPVPSENTLPTWCAIPPFTPPAPTSSNSAPSLAEALFIQFSSPHPPMTRKQRLAYLQRTISHAVLDAGMDTPSNGNNPRPSTEHPPRPGFKIPETLYCGTYGQMVSALESVGLFATPCLDTGFPGGTQIGALFVARHVGTNGVQLRKLTLWG